MVGRSYQSQRAHHADLVRQTAHSDSAAAQSTVAASWRRSLLHHRLEPESSRSPLVVTEQELEDARDPLGRLLSLAQPTLDRLFNKIGDTGCCVLLTDNQGVILEMRSKDADAQTFWQWGLRTGALWSEEAEGTNGIGTCLAERRPVFIHRDQHFLSRNTALSCVDAPIYDHEGKLIAALDVSTCRQEISKDFLSLIACTLEDAAKKIETDNFLASFHDARIILCQDDGAPGVKLVATDHDDLVIGATRAARKAFGLSNEKLSKPLPAEDILGGNAKSSGLESAERAEIRRALARSGGNVSATASLLGISRATLYRRMKKVGLI